MSRAKPTDRTLMPKNSDTAFYRQVEEGGVAFAYRPASPDKPLGLAGFDVIGTAGIGGRRVGLLRAFILTPDQMIANAILRSQHYPEAYGA